MIERFFDIKNHNDVFDAVGQIIKAGQVNIIVGGLYDCIFHSYCVIMHT